MTEQPVALLAQETAAQNEEWDTHGFWERICSSFQDALRRMWSEEHPHHTHHETTLSPPLSSPPAHQTRPSVPPLAQTSDFSWTLVLSDTDNDFQSVRRVLWLAGLCDQNGCWVPGLRNIQVVHTGDWLNKWDPNPYVLDGFKRLQETTPEGCQLVLLNGNHELSILQMVDQGLRTPLTEHDVAFIRKQNLIHTDNGVLFLHGYPSSDLLMILKQFQREEVAFEQFDERLRDVFFEGRFPLFREPRSMRVIGDIKNPKLYFNQKSQNGIHRGNYTASILQALGLNTVVHGHKPNTEVQLDHELQEEIPGIRLINNDNRIRHNNVGGLLLSHENYAVFINPQTLRDAGNERVLRKKLRKLLRTRGKDLQPKEMQKKHGKKVVRIAA